MHREERRRKFHEALVNMLYPPPPSPPQDEVEEEPVNVLRDGLNVDHVPDADELEERSSSSSRGEEGKCGHQKLTRAQRKRLRKKKLNEAASHRRKIIGPLLPTSSDNGDGQVGDVHKTQPQDIRRNAVEEPHTSEPTSCTNQNKLKQQRMTKKLARERLKSSSMENCHQGQSP